MSSFSNRNEWITSRYRDLIDNKEEMIHNCILQMLNKTTKIFKYKNLPDTIPVKDLETILQVGGHSTLKVVDGKPYAFTSGLGGIPNPYYLPTISVVANPALKYNASLEIDKDCVVVLNDHYYQGLMPLFSKYASLLIEAEISLKYAILNARVPAIIEADNDNAYESAVEFFKKIRDGKEYGIVGGEQLISGIRSHDFYKQAYIKDLIESIQYIKGSWFNEVGLNAAFNMKREAINEAEAALNEDILYPTIDTMLECRNIGFQKFNKMYGYNVEVELDSVWKQNRVRDELSIDYEKAEIDEITGGDTNEDI